MYKLSSQIKHVRRVCARLEASGKTMRDIYDVIFDHGDLTMVEMATMTRKVTKTYRAMQAEILCTARAIADKTGLQDRYIGLYGENSPAWMAAFWAILQSGNKPYLINLRQPAHFTKSILGTLDVPVVITCDKDAGLGLPTLTYDELLLHGKTCTDTPLPDFGNEIALSTNGTTLRSKICIYSGRQIAEQLLNVREMQKRNRDLVRPRGGQIRMLVFLPMYHVFGLEAMYLWYSFFGACFVFPPSMAPEALLRTVRNHKVTHIFAVPLLWHAVEKSVLSTLSTQDEKTQKNFHRGVKLSLWLQNVSPALGRFAAKKLFSSVRSRLFGDSISFCISGGSYIKPSALSLLNALGYQLHNGYGMTEIGITSVDLSRRSGYILRGAIGKPVSSVEYRIGEQGQLLVKGSSLCTRMIIDGIPQPVEDWFDTGDIVRADKTGYYIDGRISDIVFGDDGENLNPDFAEQAFVLPGALQLCVLGDEDNAKLMLLVRIPRDLLQLQKQRLTEAIEACNASLPASYRVKQIRYTYDPLSDEQAIKVSRTYLRRAIADGSVGFVELYEDKSTAQTGGEDSEIKRVLRTLFAQVLDLPEDEIRDDAHFMNELGGSSLDYFTLIGEINKKFEVSLAYESGSFGYTLNDFEKLLEELV